MIDPISGGLLAGGVLSFLGGMFGSKDIPLPSLQLSPDSLKSINFSDIDLASMNPEMYDEIMKNDRMLQDAQHMLAQRKKGVSQIEQIDIDRQRNAVANRMSAQGLAGSNVGESIMQEAEQRLRENIARQALQEQMALMQNAQQQGQNVFNMRRGAQGDIYSALAGNRQASMARDQMANERAMAEYNAKMGNQAARSQFFSGLGGGLLNAGMQNYNIGRMGSIPSGGGWDGGGLGYFSGPNPFK